MYPLVNIQRAIEHGHLHLIYILNIAISHSYVSLPEGNNLPNSANSNSQSWKSKPSGKSNVEPSIAGFPSMLRSANKVTPWNSDGGFLVPQ
jgi:hypothetical protein